MLNFIINRAAGNYTSKKVFASVKTYLNKNKIGFRVFYSLNREQIKEIVGRLEADKEDNLIVVGGDGTVHDVVNALTIPSKIKLGLIPAGKDNNFALSLGLSLKPLEALNTILLGNTIKQDLINAGGIYAVNSVLVSGDYYLKPRKQKLGQNEAFNINLLKILKSARSFSVQSFIDGLKPIEKEVNAVMLANGKINLNGLELVSSADNSDGKIEYVEFVKGALKLKFKNKALVLGEDEELKITPVKSVKITSGEDDKFDMLIDGEFVKDVLGEFLAVKGALLVFKN